MDRAGDDLFAGSVLSANQDIGVGGRDTCDRFQYRNHARRGCDELRPALRVKQTVFRGEPLCLLQSPMQLNLRPQNRKQAFIFPRLLNKVAGAAPHRFDCQFHIAPSCHDDDGQCAVLGNDSR